MLVRLFQSVKLSDDDELMRGFRFQRSASGVEWRGKLADSR